MVSELIKEAVDPAANIKFGAQIDPEMGDELVITIVATGFDENKQVYTKQLKDTDEEDGVGLGGIPVSSPVYKKAEEDRFEKKDSFFDLDEEPEEEEKEDEVQKGATRKVDMGMDDDFDDPLDKPAFMRRMFKGKKD